MRLGVLLSSICLIVLSPYCFAQMRPDLDSNINNLIHAPGYHTCQWGDLGSIKIYGKGQKNMILIPGLGFDGSVFEDFVKVNIDQYKMYVVTIAGYGGTPAPPMPPEGTSYGEQTWNKGCIAGIVKLIEKEKIGKPIVIGHFVQGTQIALRLAIDNPDKVSGVVILGGPAKMVMAVGDRVRDFPLDTMVMFTDRFTGPKWFKNMKKKWFDDNNIRPEIYSLDSALGLKLWKQSSETSLPVMVRYTSEYFASDVRADLNNLECPVLILRPAFNERIMQNPINNYVKPQYIDAWNNAANANRLIQIVDIQNSATFVWKDQPEVVYSEIKKFCERIE